MSNFIKIYLWQAISIILNFVALFVVTPYLSSQPSLFGIYSIVISLYIFLSYADLGFITAGMKYASECYARNDRNLEIRIIGFVGFIFSVFVAIYAIFIAVISFNPNILVKSLENATEVKMASQLLISLAIFSPVFVGQKIVQLIFGVRLEDYRFQRILSVANAVKILSVLYFFSDGKYRIVEYFIFSQFCGLLAVVTGGWVARKRLNYDFILLFKSFTFDRLIYNKTSKLAYASLLLTLFWIFYYEIDLFVIGRFLGPKAVAIFAIGISVLTLFRTLFGVIFTPFTAKFNHFVGLNDKEGMKSFFMKVLVIGLPLTTFPVISATMSMQSFIFSWVGSAYSDSVSLTQVLLLSYVFSFISYPAGTLVMAYEKIRALLITSAILPVIYWLGIILTYSYFGLMSFAYFKLIAFTFSAAVYSMMVIRIFSIKWTDLLSEIILPAIFPCLVLVGFMFLVRDVLPLEKSKLNLFIFAGINGLAVCLAMVVYYFSSSLFRSYSSQILNRFNFNSSKWN